MKSSAQSLLLLSVAIVALSCMLCCKKSSFTSEPGLYSLKQYHRYALASTYDSSKMADEKIRITAMDNNYLLWNNIKFHMTLNQGDTVKTYINDSMINGGYRMLYKLYYQSKIDQVSVENEARDTVWVSF